MNPRSFAVSDISSREDVAPTEGRVAFTVKDTSNGWCLPMGAGDAVFGCLSGKICEVGAVSQANIDQTQRKTAKVGRVVTDLVRLAEPVDIPLAVRSTFPDGMDGAVGDRSDDSPWNTEAVQVTPCLGMALWDLVRTHVSPIFDALEPPQTLAELLDERALHELLARADLSAERRRAMVDSYHLRGELKAVAEARGIGCIFSGEWQDMRGNNVKPCFIKPWRACSDDEKLDPDNVIFVGSSLIDAFKFGGLTMTPEGYLQVSSDLGIAYFEGSSLRSADMFPEFRPTPGQKRYFEYHNRYVFNDRGRGFG